MPVLAKFSGIAIRIMVGPTIGTRVHAFYNDTEIVIALNPVRVLQSDVPPWVEAQVLHWIHDHQAELFGPWCAIPQYEGDGGWPQPSHHAYR